MHFPARHIQPFIDFDGISGMLQSNGGGQATDTCTDNDDALGQSYPSSLVVQEMFPSPYTPHLRRSLRILDNVSTLSVPDVQELQRQRRRL
jgi:hypothetical protein